MSIPRDLMAGGPWEHPVMKSKNDIKAEYPMDPMPDVPSSPNNSPKRKMNNVSKDKPTRLDGQGLHLDRPGG